MTHPLEAYRNTPAARLNPHLFAEQAKQSKGLKPSLRGVTTKQAKGLLHIKSVLFLLKIDYAEEHRFHPARKWRFDVAVVEHKIFIEYEGLISTKSGHTTIDGYSGNCDKYNTACVMGWRGLRYTALNFENFYSDIKSILNL